MGFGPLNSNFLKDFWSPHQYCYWQSKWSFFCLFLASRPSFFWLPRPHFGSTIRLQTFHQILQTLGQEFLQYKVELRPSIGSLEIWHGSLENSPAGPRSRSKMLKKDLLELCSDREKIKNLMHGIALIQTQCSICSFDIQAQNKYGKNRKFLHFFSHQNEKISTFHIFVPNVHKVFQIN